MSLSRSQSPSKNDPTYVEPMVFFTIGLGFEKLFYVSQEWSVLRKEHGKGDVR
jgi:hypothetical protein